MFAYSIVQVCTEVNLPKGSNSRKTEGGFESPPYHNWNQFSLIHKTARWSPIRSLVLSISSPTQEGTAPTSDQRGHAPSGFPPQISEFQIPEGPEFRGRRGHIIESQAE